MDEKIEVILVDAGNTAIKSSEVIHGEISYPSSWASFQEIVDRYPSVPKIISSVRNNTLELKSLFNGPLDVVLDHHTHLPIDIDYHSIETLGVDRIAAAAGAAHLFPGQNNYIIDLGTCVTMDLIDNKGVFRGGSISPGLQMRMKSMAHFTQALPDISEEWSTIEENLLGKTTKESLLNGSFIGLLSEINGSLKTMKANFASLNVILTGGDAHFFDSRIKAHIFAGSKIVEIGLYRIWKHQ